MKPQILPTGTSVQLTWLDSTAYRGWKYGFSKHALAPPEIETLARVVACKPDYLVVSSSLSQENEGFLDPLVIPWGSILTLEVADNSIHAERDRETASDELPPPTE